MARFNEILVGRYNRSLQKLLSMKGQAVMPQLASELQPTFSFFSGAENRYLESWERFGNRQPPAALATLLCAVSLTLQDLTSSRFWKRFSSSRRPLTLAAPYSQSMRRRRPPRWPGVLIWAPHSTRAAARNRPVRFRSKTTQQQSAEGQ